jgi:transposase-like protein
MNKTRKRFSAEFKAKVAFDAAKEVLTINELSQKFEIHPNQVSLWKKELLLRGKEIFNTKADTGSIKNQELISRLYQEIGQLKVELDWVKKKVVH